MVLELLATHFLLDPKSELASWLDILESKIFSRFSPGVYIGR